MVDFVDVPTLDADFIRPFRASFNIIGNSKDGARNGLGQSISTELGGGGSVIASYDQCDVHYPEQHEYINWLSAELTGSYRFINVPIWSDWIGPFPRTDGIPLTEIITPHSDGSFFSDGSGYSQPTVYGKITAAAPYHSTIIDMELFGAEKKLWLSGWFSIAHPTKGQRAYRYRKVLSGSLQSPRYKLVIQPPLREEIKVGETVNWVRPTCVMKFEAGFVLPWTIEGFQVSTPSVRFVEAN